MQQPPSRLGFNPSTRALAQAVTAFQSIPTIWRGRLALNNEGKSLQGSNILCFGAAFKPGVSDVRNSRAIRIMEMLSERGSSVAYSDPLVDELTISNTVLRSVSVEQINQTNWDAAMVLVNANDLPLQQLSAKGIPIFDAVNAGGPPSGSRTRL